MFSFSMRSKLLCSAFALLLMLSAAAQGADEPETLRITIQDHRFTPTELHAPAGKALAIAVTNNDDSGVLELDQQEDHDRVRSRVQWRLQGNQ
jgi:hypothetical protein